MKEKKSLEQMKGMKGGKVIQITKEYFVIHIMNKSKYSSAGGVDNETGDRDEKRRKIADISAGGVDGGTGDMDFNSAQR